MTSKGKMTRPDQVDGGFATRPRSTVTAVELDGEGVLYDEATDGTHILNATATAVWSKFDGRSSVDDITRTLSAVYGADLETVRPAVLDLTRQFGRLSLLEGVWGDADEARAKGLRPAEPTAEPDVGDGPRFLPEPPSY